MKRGIARLKRKKMPGDENRRHGCAPKNACRHVSGRTVYEERRSGHRRKRIFSETLRSVGVIF